VIFGKTGCAPPAIAPLALMEDSKRVTGGDL
jgi:hypothetical protein